MAQKDENKELWVTYFTVCKGLAAAASLSYCQDTGLFQPQLSTSFSENCKVQGFCTPLMHIFSFRSTKKIHILILTFLLLYSRRFRLISIQVINILSPQQYSPSY